MAIEHEKISLLGCKIDLVDMTGALATVEDAIQDRQPCQVVTLNAEMIYYAQKDPLLRDVFARAGLVTADGIGVVWALKYIGNPGAHRVTGIDLAEELLNRAAERGWRVFLFGAQPEVVTSLAELLARRQPAVKVVGTQHGYFAESESPAIVARIKSCSPDILLVAMGAPKQDFWISRYLDELIVPVCIGVGGTFDVLAGKAQRAPAGWRRLGLEWFYRLIKEPSRWRRQMALPKFAATVILHGRKIKHQSD